MSRYYSHFAPYVSAAQRRINAQKELQKLQKKGRIIEPLGELSHRTKIATSFWGHAWCKHLESFSDYENRLPRGRTYVRNGSVLHLAITSGRIEALVQGSSLYEQTITISALPATTWKTLQSRSQGKIGSLIELLQGKVSDSWRKWRPRKPVVGARSSGSRHFRRGLPACLQSLRIHSHSAGGFLPWTEAGARTRKAYHHEPIRHSPVASQNP